MFFDLEGNKVKRTPYSFPYNYDPYVQWMSEYNKDNSHSVYSDRLWSWDSDKFNKCCEEVFGDRGQYFDKRTPDQINEFLNKYFGKKVKLTAILNCCNASSGFPYWCFIYEEISK